ncbi:mechanosensitive ion channel [Bradymonas sediminis]|uniref:Uncharacterized protein n=1 Tax=Bradymonas sediminis TaxID=1548548 RepID=A0A2Z4FJ50_9DELT|nr:mechanosensitive ion channel [Bradymonas sediminis]AWV88744.1 hypothetical protein DN745_05085 [Bradymonas sediminis]TDP63563.1 putative transporter (transmembrane protein) [Bradymonas sediminis]
MEQALNELIAFLPRLLGALLLVAVAGLVAWGARFLTRKGMEKARVDERLMKGDAKDPSAPSLTKAVSTAVFWIVLVLFLPLILDVLALQGLLAPVTAMLNDILVALPAVFGAIVVVAAAYVVGRLVRVLVTQALMRMGFDRFGERLGLSSAHTSTSAREAYNHGEYAGNLGDHERAQVARAHSEEVDGMDISTTPSSIVGSLAFVGILLFGVTAALRLMGFGALEAIVADFIVFAGEIITGLLVFAVGLWLANWAARVIHAGDSQHSHILGQLARAAILVLAGAMALRQMGLANEIITLAFAFFIGAIAVAAAIAFGIGGRDAAHELLERWRHRIERDDMQPPLAH